MTLFKLVLRLFRRLKRKPLQKLAKDELRAQAEWQVLQNKLHQKGKNQNPSQIAKLEAWGKNLFEKLFDVYHLVDSAVTTKRFREKEAAERGLEKLETDCNEIFESIPSAQQRTLFQKWQIKVLKNIDDHIDLLDYLLSEIEHH